MRARLEIHQVTHPLQLLNIKQVPKHLGSDTFVAMKEPVLYFLLLAGSIGLQGCLPKRDIELPPPIAQNAIVINEVAPRWTTAIQSPFDSLMKQREKSPFYNSDGNNYPNGAVKWFELYNNSTATIDFSQGLWYASDDTLNPTKSQFLSNLKLAPGKFAIVFCDTIIPAARDTTLHVSFNLNRPAGSSVGLFYRQNTAVALTKLDAITYPNVPNGQTYARKPDGTDRWQLTGQPTPGRSNQ